MFSGPCHVDVVWDGPTPLAQMPLLSTVPVHTSGISVLFTANFQISGSLLGAMRECGGFLGHYLADGGTALLLNTLLCRSHLVGCKMERKLNASLRTPFPNFLPIKWGPQWTVAAIIV